MVTEKGRRKGREGDDAREVGAGGKKRRNKEALGAGDEIRKLVGRRRKRKKRGRSKKGRAKEAGRPGP